MTSDVGAAGVGLVVAAPGRPSQAVGEGLIVVAVEVQESADFSKGEWDQSAMSGGGFVVFVWGRGPGRGRLFWRCVR